MRLSEKQKKLLRNLPGVDHVIELSKTNSFFDNIPKTVLLRSIRTVIDDLRNIIFTDNQDISEQTISDLTILEKIQKNVNCLMKPNLLRVINATGVVIHTNLGRSLLAKEAIKHIITVSSYYSNLEFNLSTGKRGVRYSCVDDILCELCGAEAAMVVNNNAAAVFLCLETIAKSRKVIVSRGELVEIGGSFRIPDIMAKSGCILSEVGTTNRTHLKDYENAIERDTDRNTGLLLKVHTSNYNVVGFTASVSLNELVELGKKHQIPVMEDLGSGTFIDFSKFNLLKEPTITESVTAGVDIVTFSGDKLLGGPQAGIIVGKKKIIDKIKKNPIARILRIDKLTLAALEATLRLYRNTDQAVKMIPTLAMLTCPFEQIEKKAVVLSSMLESIKDPRMKINVFDISSRVGGGALPLLKLPSKCMGISIQEISANTIESHMRKNDCPIIGRIENDLFILDLRTIQDDELSVIKTAFANMLHIHR